jgi:hypothetical protein
MTPKEKAFHLYYKYIREVIADNEKAKKCALIAVDEIIDVIKFNKYDDKYWEEEQYWNEVKEEILNIK